MASGSGIGVAFLIDALSFLVSAATLWFVSGIRAVAQHGKGLPEGAAALGLILSAHGLGNLLGIAAGGSPRRPRPRVLGATVVGLFLGFGGSLAALAFIRSTWIAPPIMALVDIGNGYLAVAIMSLLQRLAPREMLRRVMSLVMLFMFGLIPVSQYTQPSRRSLPRPREPAACSSSRRPAACFVLVA